MINLPDNWNCMIASFAMLLNKEYAEIEALLPDWTIINAGYTVGIHIEQLQEVCLNMGFALIPYVKSITYNPILCPENVLKILDSEEPSLDEIRDLFDPANDYTIRFNSSFAQVLSLFDGLLLGRYTDSPGNHAVTWSHKERMIYAPERRTCRITEFDCDSFWAFRKL